MNDQSKSSYQYKPFKFWFLTLVITWVSLFVAAYFSHQPELLPYKNIFILISLFTPFTVAMFMIYGSKNQQLKQDFRKRLFNFKFIKPKYWLAILLIMPLALLTATAISLIFGQSVQQFSFSPELRTFGGEVLIMLIILILAPTFEELGWRGYGLDSLKKSRSIFKTTIIYTVLWIAWHLPLFFIKGYYHYEVFHIHIIYALNLLFSMIPAAFLMNWIYYKNNRSIFAIIILHVILNLFSVLLQTEQLTKCIITIILSVVVVFIISKDKNFFFDR